MPAWVGGHIQIVPNAEAGDAVLEAPVDGTSHNGKEKVKEGKICGKRGGGKTKGNNGGDHKVGHPKRLGDGGFYWISLLVGRRPRMAPKTLGKREKREVLVGFGIR